MAALLDVEGVLGRDRGRVPIVYALAREEPTDPSSMAPRTTQVPAEWYDSVARSFELREELLAEHLSGILDLFVVPGDLQRRSASLSLTVSGEGAREAILDFLRDVAVEADVSVLEEMPPREGTEADPEDARRVADADHSSVPGGVFCTTVEGSGTLTPAVYESGTASPWFATSNHVFGAAGTKEDEHVGEPLFVAAEDDRSTIGEVHRGYPGEDVVQVRPVGGYRPASRISGASPSTVGGHFTRYGLALLAARGEPLEKVGAFSGHTTGTIHGVDGVTCYVGTVCKAGQLKWGSEDAITDGDSGSVNYHPDPEHPDEYLLVGGINSARTWWPGADFTWGTAAHHLASARGLHF